MQNMYGFFCVYTYILFSVSVYICVLKFLLHNVLKYGIFVVTGFVCPFLQTYIHIGKSPSKRFKMRMMQYFKHIEYADKIFLFLLLFDVVYQHKQTAKRGKRKGLKKILKIIDKIFCGFKNYIYLCCVETNETYFNNGEPAD